MTGHYMYIFNGSCYNEYMPYVRFTSSQEFCGDCYINASHE